MRVPIMCHACGQRSTIGSEKLSSLSTCTACGADELDVDEGIETETAELATAASKTAMDRDVWQADYDKLHDAIPADAIIDFGDGTQGIDQSRVNPDILRMYQELYQAGMANGYFASKKTAAISWSSFVTTLGLKQWRAQNVHPLAITIREKSRGGKSGYKYNVALEHAQMQWDVLAEGETSTVAEAKKVCEEVARSRATSSMKTAVNWHNLDWRHSEMLSRYGYENWTVTIGAFPGATEEQAAYSLEVWRWRDGRMEWSVNFLSPRGGESEVGGGTCTSVEMGQSAAISFVIPLVDSGLNADDLAAEGSRRTAANWGIFSIEDDSVIYGPTTESNVQVAIDSGRYPKDEYYAGTMPDPREIQRSNTPGGVIGDPDPYGAGFHEPSPTYEAKLSKVKEVRDGILVSNPGMDRTAASKLAVSTVNKFPGMVKA